MCIDYLACSYEGPCYFGSDKIRINSRLLKREGPNGYFKELIQYQKLNNTGARSIRINKTLANQPVIKRFDTEK